MQKKNTVVLSIILLSIVMTPSIAPLGELFSTIVSNPIFILPTSMELFYTDEYGEEIVVLSKTFDTQKFELSG